MILKLVLTADKNSNLLNFLIENNQSLLITHGDMITKLPADFWPSHWNSGLFAICMYALRPTHIARLESFFTSNFDVASATTSIMFIPDYVYLNTSDMFLSTNLLNYFKLRSIPSHTAFQWQNLRLIFASTHGIMIEDNGRKIFIMYNLWDEKMLSNFDFIIATPLIPYEALLKLPAGIKSKVIVIRTNDKISLTEKSAFYQCFNTKEISDSCQSIDLLTTDFHDQLSTVCCCDFFATTPSTVVSDSKSNLAITPPTSSS